MKYCYQCGHMTQGDPAYCNFCGRSYDVKLCPRLHQNPRGAECCSQCGSRDLSTPQPKIPMSWRLAALMARLGIGLLLFSLTLSVLVLVLRTPEFRRWLVAIGAVICGLWGLYSKLPDWLQDLLRSLWKRKSRDDDTE